MPKVFLVFVAAASAVTGLFAGIFLGAWLGRIGALEALRTFARLPLVLLRSPGQLKNQWKVWGEQRSRRKVERIRYRNQMKELKGKIATHRSGIRATRVEIRRARWQSMEPR